MKKLGKIISLIMALAMLLTLAACGGKTGDTQNPGSSGDKTQEAKPEFAYKADYKKVNNNNRDIYPKLFTDEGFYYTSSEVVGQRELREGETLEWEGQLDVYATSIYFSDFEGNVRKLEGFDAEPFTDRLSEEGHNLYGYINSMACDTNGNLVILASLSENWQDDDPTAAADEPMPYEDFAMNYHYKESYYMKWLDATGAEISSALLAENDETSESYFYINSLKLTDEGYAVATTDGGILVYNPDGSEAFRIETEYYPEKLVMLQDGSVAVSMWAESGYSLQVIDFNAKGLGKSYPMPNEAWDVIEGAGDYDFYYNNGSTFFGYDLESGESEKIFKWLDLDINGNNMSAFAVREDGSIFTVENQWDDEYQKVTTSYVTISKVPYDSVPHKQAITLATMYLDWDVQEAILKFNRAHDNVRISVTDYSEYNTEEDYEAGLTKLRAEMLAGNCPDIVDLNYVSASQLAAKGLLEDLYPYLDADSELGRDALMTNIIDALSINGKLYQTCSGFNIQTLAGARSIVGDTPGWTYDDVYAALEKMPEGCDILDYYTTRSDILQACLGFEMNRLIDWSTGECRFDSQDFIDLLNFAKHFQSEFDWENYEWTEEDSTENRIMQGKQMLMSTYVYSFMDMLYNDYYFGNEMVFIGYPTNEGVGNIIGCSGAYGMSSKCADKQAAWEFLRMFFTEEYQARYSYDFPTNKKTFDEKLKEAMTPIYATDMNGNTLLDENGEPIQQSRGGMGTENGEMIEFYALTQDQADRLLALINSSDRVMTNTYYDSIAPIVVEQAQAFFAGQKSAEEVAKLIQNKVTILVNEQR